MQTLEDFIRTQYDPVNKFNSTKVQHKIVELFELWSLTVMSLIKSKKFELEIANLTLETLLKLISCILDVKRLWASLSEIRKEEAEKLCKKLEDWSKNQAFYCAQDEHDRISSLIQAYLEKDQSPKIVTIDDDW